MSALDNLESNLMVLASSQPELAEKIRHTNIDSNYQLETAKSGIPTLKVNGISYHSAYDPIAEAQKLLERIPIEANRLALLKGFGLGYFAEALISSGRKLVVADADLAVLKLAFESRDLREVISKALFFVGEEPHRFKEFLGKWGLNSDYQEINFTPAVKAHPDFYHSLTTEPVSLSIAPDKIETPKGLKILMPSPLYGGSLPIAGYCKNALESLGHKVEYLDFSFYYPAFKSVETITDNREHQGKLRSIFTVFLAEMVLAKAMEWKPDLIFGVAQSPFTTETVNEFKVLKIPVAFWFMEDYRLFAYWKQFAPLYDYFFTIQRGEFTELLKKVGAKHTPYLPLAADSAIHKPVELTPEEKAELGSQISFVGAGYHNRRQFFLQLLSKDFKIWGTEWDLFSPLGRVIQRKGARISTEDCVKIFNATEININLHSSSYHSGVNPHGDFVNPRVFEIASSGAFQLVDPRSELPELFKIGEEIVTFRSIEELREMKKYYLEHPYERKQIAEAGRQRVLAEHTYRQRMMTMLDYIARFEPTLQKRSESPNLAKNLLQEAKDDPALRELFSKFNPEEELDVDKIAAVIRKGKGELTQTEGIFLLMKEFYDWAREKKVV
jgi:spore maturation protein CgeB